MRVTGERSNTLVQGTHCPLCLPRDDYTSSWVKVSGLEVSSLYLDRNQTYRGHCQLVFDPRHAVGLESLLPDEFAAFMSDLRTAARAIVAACHPDLMNYVSLGNVVPHLHWHLVPRYKHDPRWGAPIYTTNSEDMRDTSFSAAEYRELVEAIGQRLSHPTSPERS